MADGGEQDLGMVFQKARKRPMNFALLMGKEGLVFETHIKKAPGVLRKLAKKNGGGPKGTCGQMSVSGRVVELHVEDDDFPGILPKLAKKHFASEGFKFKFQIHLPNGEIIGDGEEESPEEEAATGGAPEEETAEATANGAGAPGDDVAMQEEEEEIQAATGAGAAESGSAPEGTGPEEGGGTDIAAERARLVNDFKSMNTDLRTALASAEAPVKKRLSTLAKAFGDEVKGENMTKAGGILTLLQRTLTDGGAATNGAANGAGGETGGADPQTAERRTQRRGALADIESRVDALLAQFAS